MLGFLQVELRTHMAGSPHCTDEGSHDRAERVRRKVRIPHGGHAVALEVRSMEGAQGNDARRAPLKDGPEIQYASLGFIP